MSRVYLDRDNDVILLLKQDGSIVNENAITKAEVWIPGAATQDGNPLVVDSENDPDVVEMINNATQVKVRAGHLDLIPGSYQTFLTIFDENHPLGIAWGKPRLKVTEWIPE